VAKHCSHSVLKVFDGLLPLIHLLTTRTESLNIISWVQTEWGVAVINGKAAPMELT
jgi:hypothetical protein